LFTTLRREIVLDQEEHITCSLRLYYETDCTVFGYLNFHKRRFILRKTFSVHSAPIRPQRYNSVGDEREISRTQGYQASKTLCLRGRLVYISGTFMETGKPFQAVYTWETILLMNENMRVNIVTL
jgi:hypothetical protein